MRHWLDGFVPNLEMEFRGTYFYRGPDQDDFLKLILDWCEDNGCMFRTPSTQAKENTGPGSFDVGQRADELLHSQLVFYRLRRKTS